MFDDGWVLEVLEQLTADAAKQADAPLWSLSDTEITESVQAAYRLEQAAAAVKLRLVRQLEARGIPGREQFRTTAHWLRSRLRLDPQPARELVEQAAVIDQRPVVGQALTAGAVDVKQAAVIAAAVEAVPAEAGAEVKAEAEKILIDWAAQFEPYKLRRLGARVLEHVAPEIAERAEREALERAEERAHQGRFLTLSMPVDGCVRLSGSLSVEDAAVVRSALDPLCTPHPDDERNPGQCRADALVDVCRLALRGGDLPRHGGEPPQLSVTVGFDPLERRLTTATLDNGERLSPAAARRLACDAQVLPVVLGSAGQVLDAGRSRRLATGSLRRALAVRDRGCAFPTCDRPPRWCDAHHVRSWVDGGATELGNLVLLCRQHHRMIHGDGWQVRFADDELPEFVPPRWIDELQRPRRNLYHRRT